MLFKVSSKVVAITNRVTFSEASPHNNPHCVITCGKWSDDETQERHAMSNVYRLLHFHHQHD